MNPRRTSVGRICASRLWDRCWRRLPHEGNWEAELKRLAAKEWLHPVTGQAVRFARSTIQRWYYAARREKSDPVGILRRKIRKDAGEQSSLNADLRCLLQAQYRAHPRWSYQLHVDNLDVLVKENPRWGSMPSYSANNAHATPQ